MPSPGGRQLGLGRLRRNVHRKSMPGATAWRAAGATPSDERPASSPRFCQPLAPRFGICARDGREVDTERCCQSPVGRERLPVVKAACGDIIREGATMRK